jgi:hypothetical protein
MRKKVCKYLEDGNPKLWDQLTTMEQKYCLAKQGKKKSKPEPAPKK